MNKINIDKYVLLVVLILFAISTIPEIKGYLPYYGLISSDDIYPVDQAVGYTTGNFSRSMSSIGLLPYNDFPIILDSYCLFVHKVIWSLYYLLKDNKFNSKLTSEKMYNIHSELKTINQNYYNYYFTNPTTFFIIARIVTLLFALLSLTVSYKIAHIFLNNKWSILVVILIALLPVFHRCASSTKGDMALTFTSLSFLYFALKIIIKRNYKYLALVGFFFGLSIGTKSNAVVLLIPFIYILFVTVKNFSREEAPINKILCFSIGGFVFSFLIFGPNYIFNNISINLAVIFNFATNIYRGIRTHDAIFGTVLYNMLKQFWFILGVMVIVGLFVFFFNKKYKKEIRYLVIFYLISISVIFIVRSQLLFSSARMILPSIPIFAILAIYGTHCIFQKIDYNNNLKKVIFLIFIFGSFIPLIIKDYSQINSNINCMNDTRISSKNWIKKNISINKRLFYLGRYEYMPPIRARNRMAEDRRRDEKFNQSLKIHFDRFLSEIADSDRYYIEDFTGRYWRKEEFEDILNLEHLKENNIDYVVYCPDYFKRFDSKGFEKQKSVVDKMIDDVRRNAVLMKEFKSRVEIMNGPTIQIYKF